jgi:hypothetical protein
LRVLHIPVTLASDTLAICTANDPTTGRADDEHPLAWFDMAMIMQSLPARQRNLRTHDRCLFEGDGARLRCELVRRRPGILGERAPIGSVHFVTDPKPAHVLPNCFDGPATLVPGTGTCDKTGNFSVDVFELLPVPM